ncbi:MAG: hypothetical protein IT381_02805 [Deltaproteobacteria bacterium]|nr:hypothetical protein [Deltaproteobacteria bacterium]
MQKHTLSLGPLAIALLIPNAVFAGDIVAKSIAADLSKADPTASYWANVAGEQVSLMAQPMVAPRPKTTMTPFVTVQAVHDGHWLAFRLRWKDTEKSEAGKLGETSDALAIQFPINESETPPPIFMGTKGNPVHIFHWRAQYQRDAERGKPTMRDLYPNMMIDMYPMEYSDYGNMKKPGDEQREKFSPGRAEGNPQAYEKSGVDEIYAEGFSTSSVQEGGGSHARGVWQNGEWTLVITRELKREGGSVCPVGRKTFAAFAVWQGGSSEVGSRKSVTMQWSTVQIEATKEAKR